MQTKKSILIIMDGWGLGTVKSSDAIQNANVPFVTSLYTKYPNSTLITCGTEVGLPDGQMGNSEVGHLNLGAGRIVYQDLERINVAIRDKSFFENETILNSINYAIENNKTLHLLGLVSDGGVHSHIEHIKAITTLCAAQNFNNVLIHAFTDGRDTDPKSGLGFIQDLQAHLEKTTGKIATLTGRYYAMDRDKRWERVKIAYDAMLHAVGEKTNMQKM
jgi:2,3-bisphosphoglycerate-independent phosphoglycerate mutase